MLERDFIKTVATRQNADGKWEFGLIREGRETRFACGSYVSEKAAVRAAVRRFYR